MESREKIKVGIIGVGSISKYHIQAYLANPAVELVAFCDSDETRLAAMAEKHGIKHTFTDTDMHKMLAMPGLDAVSICTWNTEHMPCAIAALQAGKHVLCEKPMAATEQQALEMQRAAQQSGKLLMVGFVRRFGKDFAQMEELVADGYFGEIYHAKAAYLRRNGNPGGWFGDKSRSGGGPLIDLGVHIIDLTRYMMGNPKPVSVYGATFQKLFNRPHIKGKKGYSSASAGVQDICDVEDMATALVRYDNGAVLQVEAAFSLNIKEETSSIEFFGNRAGARFSPDFEIYTELNGYLADITLEKPEIDFNDLFKSEINHFIDCIQNGTSCKAPAEDGIVVMRILDAIYESARTGHEVIL